MARVTNLIRRIKSELDEILNDPPEGCSARPLNDDELFVLKACIIGPDDSPYKGFSLYLTYRFKTDYPFRPPNVRFISQIYHPNITREGLISLNILQPDWNPTIRVANVLEGIRWLLSNPNPHDTFNFEAGKLYLEDTAAFYEQARSHLVQRITSIT